MYVGSACLCSGTDPGHAHEHFPPAEDGLPCVSGCTYGLGSMIMHSPHRQAVAVGKMTLLGRWFAYVRTWHRFALACSSYVRRLWHLAIGEGHPRFASFDQKPAWFNSVAERGTYAMKGAKVVACKEKHSDSRQRYSIMTQVQSHRQAGAVALAPEPPRIAVLFKGKTPRILAELDAPQWVLLQHAENGSYRTENVTEFLEFALPRAERPQDSIIVMLDWYAPHCSAQVPSMSRVVRQRLRAFHAVRTFMAVVVAEWHRGVSFRFESA